MSWNEWKWTDYYNRVSKSIWNVKNNFFVKEFTNELECMSSHKSFLIKLKEKY